VKLTIHEIAQAVNGQLDTSAFAEKEITSVEFDSRKIVDGSLFVALKEKGQELKDNLSEKLPHGEKEAEENSEEKIEDET